VNCVEECEFLKFKDGNFWCEYYDSELKYYLQEAMGDLKIVRCDKCLEEKKIGSNTIQEKVKKLKYRIGLIMDSFYSFKDDIESEMTELYRILKDLEEECEIEKE